MDRTDPGLASDERTMMLEFLDYHRATFVQKVTGLTSAELDRTTVPTSALTLGGLLKHLAHVEDSWLTHRFAGGPIPEPWASAPFDHDEDWDLHSATDDSPEELLALYATACDRSREVVDGASFDDVSAALDSGGTERFTLRWIVLHLIEETARHNGHVDLLREAIDGATGE